MSNQLSSMKCVVITVCRCEERVLAVNEAMMLDSAKPAGGVTDDTKPLNDRQTQLAALVEKMVGANKSFDGKVCSLLLHSFVFSWIVRTIRRSGQRTERLET